jgi:ribosomal protein S12 methylthiotransferase accessory factor
MDSLQHDAGGLRGVLSWIDDRFGPIIKLSGFPLYPPDPRWWLYACDLARAPIGTWTSPSYFGSSGASIDASEALQRALGETVERYCSMNPGPLDEESFLLRPADGGMAGHFPTCSVNEPCPASLKGFEHVTTEVPHVRARFLANDGHVPIPKAFAEIQMRQRPDEPLLTLPISTGLAFQPELWAAVWRGLCEVAERDAMMLMWWLREPSPEISTQGLSVPLPLHERMRRIAQANLVARLFDVSTDYRVPTVFAVVCGESFPYLTAGASCHSDPALACTKALDEAVAARVGARGDRWSRDIPSLSTFSWVRLLEHHMMLYAGWRKTPALDFLLERGRSVSYDEFAERDWWAAPEGPGNLDTIAKRLASIDLTGLWIDLTTPEVAEFGSVARVCVPEMLPLSQDHNVRWLGTPRLLKRMRRGVSLNPYPHPFA